MPLYNYKCSSCGVSFDEFAKMEDCEKPAPCKCGASAERQPFAKMPAVHGLTTFVDRNNNSKQYKFDKRKNVRTARWQKSAAKVEKHYEGTMERMLRQAKEWNNSSQARKEGIEIDAIMPAPLADSMADHEGDKNAVLSDPIPFAKATGTYVGRS